MGDVIFLKPRDLLDQEKMEREIVESLSHPNKEVLNLWGDMAIEFFRKICERPQKPENTELSFKLPSCVKAHEAEEIQKDIQVYVSDIKDFMDLHIKELSAEVFSLQKQIAELKVGKVNT